MLGSSEGHKHPKVLSSLAAVTTMTSTMPMGFSYGLLGYGMVALTMVGVRIRRSLYQLVGLSRNQGMASFFTTSLLLWMKGEQLLKMT